MLEALFTQPKPRKKVTFHSPVFTKVELEPARTHSRENNSDIESIRAEAGTDDELNKLTSTVAKVKGKGKEKMSTTNDSSDAVPEWTRKEDRSLCVMKSEAKTWGEIGKNLERGRKECQQRYRALSSHAKELGITTEKLAKLYISEDEEKAKSKSKTKTKKSGKSKDNSKSKDDGEEKSKSKEKSKGKSKKGATKPDSDSETESKPESRSKSKSKSKKKNNRVTKAPSSSEDSDSSSADDEDAAEDPEAEYWEHRRYIYDTLYGQIYPDQKTLRPDRFYSESDCRVLAGLEARYRADKWLHIQADFCNATGRMVEAEILKAKFYEDEVEE